MRAVRPHEKASISTRARSSDARALKRQSSVRASNRSANEMRRGRRRFSRASATRRGLRAHDLAFLLQMRGQQAAICEAVDSESRGRGSRSGRRRHPPGAAVMTRRGPTA